MSQGTNDEPVPLDVNQILEEDLRLNNTARQLVGKKPYTLKEFKDHLMDLAKTLEQSKKVK